MRNNADGDRKKRRKCLWDLNMVLRDCDGWARNDGAGGGVVVRGDDGHVCRGRVWQCGEAAVSHAVCHGKCHTASLLSSCHSHPPAPVPPRTGVQFWTRNLTSTELFLKICCFYFFFQIFPSPTLPCTLFGFKTQQVVFMF